LKGAAGRLSAISRGQTTVLEEIVDVKTANYVGRVVKKAKMGQEECVIVDIVDISAAAISVRRRKPRRRKESRRMS
jgi:hypothetical protein